MGGWVGRGLTCFELIAPEDALEEEGGFPRPPPPPLPIPSSFLFGWEEGEREESFE